MRKKILKATHAGDIHLANTTIPCAVLEDGSRVLTQRGLYSAIGRSSSTGALKGGAHELPRFLQPANLKPFIDDDLRCASEPIIFMPKSGGSRAYGFTAEILPKICDVYLNARDANALSANQINIAKACDALVRGLAQVGIVALIDEATGYQEIRDRKALQAILDKYLEKELAAWAKRFPDEFYQQIFRLRGWQWKGMHINRPSVVGKYTNDLVYERLAPGILTELQKRNPVIANGRRKAKHQQWLTEDVGHPALAQHLYGVVGMMRAATTWDQFYRLVQRAYPKKGENLLLDFQD